MKYLAPVAEIETTAAILSDDKVEILDKLVQPENDNEFLFIWDATKNTLIENEII